MQTPDRAAPVDKWLAAPLELAVQKSIHKLSLAEGVTRLAIMPDVHLAQDVCIGVVVASESMLYPAAVGGDIGCGMAAVAFDCEAALLADEHNAARLLTALYDAVPANKHKQNSAISSLPDELSQVDLDGKQLERMKHREARLQFGTLGRGNHFLEFQQDEDQRLWLMVHSGSRAIGQAIRDHHARGALGKGLPYLEANTEEGRSYFADHLWAIKYAELSRVRMMERTGRLMKWLFSVPADWDTFLQCHHNHIQQEIHHGQQLWVHRKGALDAHKGKRGMIPGSMGSVSFHVTGKGHDLSLTSSSHGAGRRMSRSEARRRIHQSRLEQEMKGVLFDHRMARRLCDEAPSAYRDINKVMRAQQELTRIDRKLWPILSYKGG